MTSDEKQKALEPVIIAAQKFYYQVNNNNDGDMNVLYDSFDCQKVFEYILEFIKLRDAGMIDAGINSTVTGKQ